VTAANASAINDGASALVLTTLERSKTTSAKPIARILSWGDAATHPIDFTIAPSLAIPIALKRAGLEVKDIAKFEINEVCPLHLMLRILLMIGFCGGEFSK
jgi:acetyl-CoA C-acetyltransferase